MDSSLSKFTYSDYCKACLEQDFKKMANNYTKIDAFFCVWNKKCDDCYTLTTYPSKNRYKLGKTKPFFKTLIDSDDERYDFCCWLTFHFYDDFLAFPESELTKELYKQFSSDPKREIAAICSMELFETHILPKMSEKEQNLYKNLDEEGFKYYIKNYLVFDNCLTLP